MGGSFLERNGWLLGGLGCLLVACFLAAAAIPGKPNDKFVVFTADGSFATLAGFTVLAIALERLCEAVLAPWWGKTKAEDVKTPATKVGGKVAASAKPALLGASDLKKVAVLARAVAAAPAPAGDANDSAEQAATEKKEAAEQAADAADSAWVKVTRDRPTIVLPAAAIATVACAHLHLFLLHGISKAGVPTSELAYVMDALVTGLALAGGAKPFHDLVEGLSAKKDAAVATAAGSSAA